MKILVNNEVRQMTAEEEEALNAIPNQQEINAEEALNIILGGEST